MTAPMLLADTNAPTTLVVAHKAPKATRKPSSVVSTPVPSSVVNTSVTLSGACLAGWNAGVSEEATIEAIRKAGGDQADVKAEFTVGRMAFTLRGDLSQRDAIAQAVHLLTLHGATSTTAPDAEKRTEVQERAYRAAAKLWERMLTAAGLKTSETRGGTRTKTTAAPSLAIVADAAAIDPTEFAGTGAISVWSRASRRRAVR